MKLNVSDELNSLMQECKNKIDNFPWSDRACYSAWVAQTYYFVSHSTRLLALSAARTPLEAQEYHVRFLAHTAEEKGHEKLLVNDMKGLGSKMSDWPEMSAASAMYQTQYYHIEHSSPMAFFGYILALEALAARFGGEIGKKVEASFGPKAAHFLRVHAEEDIGHVEEAMEKINHLPPDQQQLVLSNLRQSLTYYIQMLDECVAYGRSRARSAA
nr:iron-containing redox enzyme family protein [Bdellovibrio sp. HAGR004]